MKDRIWFYTTFRRWGVDQTITDSFYNADPTHRTYVADLARPTVDDNVIKSGAARITLGHRRQAQVRRLPGSHHQVPRPRMPRAFSRGGVRHPESEALLHGAGEVHRRR